MSLHLDVHVGVRAAPSAFIALALDLPRVCALHPRLVEARWLDEPVVPGARGTVTAELPAGLGMLSSIAGRPTGVLTLTAHRPGRSVAYRLDAERLAGIVEIAASEPSDPPAITVRGSLWASSTLARATMAPASAVLEPILAGVVRRTVRRADQLLLL